MLTLLILLAIVVAVAFWGVGIYNGLVTSRNGYKNAFAQIDVQLQRRFDLIPNLVEVAKKYMAHERETLEAVIKARNAAHGAMQKAESNPTDGNALRELAGAEAALGGMLTRFFALAEAYPDLKANQNMAQLQEELASTENRIAFARQAFNDAVMSYNIKRETFPDSFIANTFNFSAAEEWKMADLGARDNVKVSFN